MNIEEFKDVRAIDEPNKHRLRKVEIQDLFEFQPFIDGYHMQFGVHKGATLDIMAKLKPEVTWHGFDSFEGLPNDWDLGEKIVKWDKFKLSEPPQVRDNVVLVEGWYVDTVPEFEKVMTGPIAFMDIDCDVYKSARTVLFGMDTRIVPGTVIRFDEICDWRTLKGWVKNKGRVSKYTTWAEHEWKALNEWIKECNRTIKPIHRSNHMSGTVLVTQ